MTPTFESFASLNAHAIPPKPAPMTITCFFLDGSGFTDVEGRYWLELEARVVCKVIEADKFLP